MIETNYLWIDYEGYGWFNGRQKESSRAWDRPSQFAAQATNHFFEPIGDPVNLYCKPSLDHLPSANAALITKINPLSMMSKGLCEYDFAMSLLGLFSKGNTCTIGYNAHRYDHQLTRYLMSRNLIDPWGWQWKNGNKHWDAQLIVQTCWAIRPTLLKWPKVDKNGGGRLKLDRLSMANGVSHENAHDAFGDVKALIDLMTVIDSNSKALIPTLYSRIDKRQTIHYIKRCIAHHCPILHINGYLGYARQFMTVCLPIAQSSISENLFIAIDLNVDLSDIFALDAVTLKSRLFRKGTDTPEGQKRPGILLIKANETPVLLEEKFLNKDDKHFGLNRALINENLARIQSDQNIKHKMRDIVNEPYQRDETIDLDAQFRFKSNKDVDTCISFHEASVDDKFRLDWEFEDETLSIMKERLLARNWPERLSRVQSKLWGQRCRFVYEMMYPIRKNELDTTRKETRLSTDDFDLLDSIEAHWSNINDRISQLEGK